MSIIAKIEEHLNINEILQLLPNLEQQGNEYIGMCPTGHASQSKISFHLNAQAPNFHCLNCGVSGSYIHLVELINFGVSSKGKGGTETFKQTLKLLAEKYGLSDGEYEKKESVFDIIKWIIDDYHEQFKNTEESLIQGILNKYGLTQEFVNKEKWGFGGDCPSKRASDFWSAADLLSTGLFYPSKRSPAGVFHIYSGRIVMPYNALGRPLYSIGRRTSKVTPYTKNGKTGHIPKYVKQFIHKNEHDYVSKSVKNVLVSHHKNKDEIIITEGITDYLSLKMHGFNSVSPVTTSFKKDDCERVSIFCRDFRRIYICNDNEVSEAGQKGAKKICDMLTRDQMDPYIIELPLAADEEKMDTAEFLKLNGVDKFNELKNNSKSYIEFLINEIPSDIDQRYLIHELSQVIDLLSSQSIGTVSIYLKDHIKKRFKPTQEIIKEIMSNIKGNKTNSKLFDKEETDELGAIKIMNPGQDFIDNTLYYTVSKPTRKVDEKGGIELVHTKYIVSSDRKMSEVKNGNMADGNIMFEKKFSPRIKFDSWRFNGSPYSVENFLANKTDVNPAELFKRIRSFIDRHVFFRNDYESSFLATAIMAWSCFMVFDAIGFLHLWAEKQSGKTTVMEILEMLALNADMSTSITVAYIFRSIDASRPVLLIDEAENLNPSYKARENAPSELLEVLKGSYKKSGFASRCEGQNNEITKFSAYCPKVFASIKKPDGVLGDRLIISRMERVPGVLKLDDLYDINSKKETKDIRDMIYCFGLQHASAINNIYHKELSKRRDELDQAGVIARLKELWSPYLCIAVLVDKHDPEINLFDTLLEKVKFNAQLKATFMDDNKDAEIIELLYVWMKEVQAGDRIDMENLYQGHRYLQLGVRKSFVTNVLRNPEHEDRFQYFKSKDIEKMLFSHNIMDASHMHKNHRQRGENIRKVAWSILPDNVLKALIRFNRSYPYEIETDIQEYKDRSNEPIPDKVIPTFESEGID
jgi:DNA primase